MQTYGEMNVGYSFAHFGIRWSSALSFTTWLLFYRSQYLVPFALAAGCIPQPLWTLWRREKCLSLQGIKPRLSSLLTTYSVD
jgi:hypothetical protein